MSRSAALHSASTSWPSHGWSVKAIRSRPGSRPTSSRKGRAGSGAAYGAPASGPAVASRIAALSRTERQTTCSTTAPCQISPKSGPVGSRPRVGFMPKSPQQEAGIRIEPPPSPPVATGVIPHATAAAEPPLEPPAVRVRSHGLRVGPKSAGSVNGVRPNSGVLVLPRSTKPAWR